MNDINTEIGIAFQATQLILVFLTVFFSLRYPQIKKALNKEIPETEKTIARDNLIKELVKTVHKNLPLLILSISMFWLFSPLFSRVILNSNFDLWNFDFARTSFVVITLMIFLFSGWSIKLILEVIFKIHSINKNWKKVFSVLKEY